MSRTTKVDTHTGEDPLNLDVKVGRLPGAGLVQDYHAGHSALGPFFFGFPWDPETYRRKADEVRARFDARDRAYLAEAVTPSSDVAADKLRRIAAGDGFFVTTGQQTGFLTGPLYTVHKTLSAIALADALEDVLEVPVAPLFWVASDDHDWDKVNHVQFLDDDNESRRIDLGPAADRRPSIGRRTLGREIERALDRVEEVLPPSEFMPDLMTSLREAYRPGRTMADAFRTLVLDLFGPFDLLVTDAQDPVVREVGGEVVRRELKASEDHEGALAAQTARLEAAGYEAQVSLIPGATNVFYEDEHGRERIVRQDGRYMLRASHRGLEEDELWSMWEADHGRFSANVLLRPVVESHVFPTLAYVAGPGELRYLAQAGCLFERHGLAMPVVFPRFSVTVVESKVQKVLDKFGLSWNAFDRPVHEIVAEYVRAEVPDAVSEALSGLRRDIQRGHDALFEAAKPIDPTLKGPIFHARNTAFQALGEAEKKIKHHVRQQHEIGVEQLEKAARNLHPENKPQERVLNVFQYLSRYGRELLPAIRSRMEVSLAGTADGWSGVDCPS